MKKVWLLSLSLVMGTLIAALGLLGCQDTATNPADITTTEGYPSIGNPSPSAKAYPGVVLVTWPVVKDAKSYYVVRTDLTTKETVNLDRVEATSYADKVSFSNQLVNEREYQYTVIAASGQSTSGLQNLCSSWSETGVSIVGDGIGTSNKVVANVPAFDSAGPIVAPAADKITIRKQARSDNSYNPSDSSSDSSYPVYGNTDNDEYLEVFWTDPDLTTPNFTSYKVTYYFGYQSVYTGGDGDYDYTNSFSYYEDGYPNGGTGVHYVKFPLVGGIPAIRVESTWPDHYYVAKDVTKYGESIPSTYWFDVRSVDVSKETFRYDKYDYNYYDSSTFNPSTYNRTSTRISWPAVSGVAVSDSGYSVYRTKRVTTGTPLAQDTINWEKVTADEYYVAEDYTYSLNEEGGHTWTWSPRTWRTDGYGNVFIYDAAPLSDGYYQYLVIATGPNGQKSQNPAISPVFDY